MKIKITKDTPEGRVEIVLAKDYTCLADINQDELQEVLRITRLKKGELPMAILATIHEKKAHLGDCSFSAIP